MAKGQDQINEYTTVTLNLDDDMSLECGVITIYEACGKTYIALSPLDEDSEFYGEVYLYGYSVVAGEPTLEYIADDEEYDIAADGYDEWLDEQAFAELPELPDME